MLLPYLDQAPVYNSIDFNIETDVAPTYIQIANTGDADIYLAGDINNPKIPVRFVAKYGTVMHQAH